MASRGPQHQHHGSSSHVRVPGMQPGGGSWDEATGFPRGELQSQPWGQRPPQGNSVSHASPFEVPRTTPQERGRRGRGAGRSVFRRWRVRQSPWAEPPSAGGGHARGGSSCSCLSEPNFKDRWFSQRPSLRRSWGTRLFVTPGFPGVTRPWPSPPRGHTRPAVAAAARGLPPQHGGLLGAGILLSRSKGDRAPD